MQGKFIDTLLPQEAALLSLQASVLKAQPRTMRETLPSPSAWLPGQTAPLQEMCPVSYLIYGLPHEVLLHGNIVAN